MRSMLLPFFHIISGFGYHYIHRAYFTNTETTAGNVVLEIGGVSKALLEEDIMILEGFRKLLKI